MNVVLNDIAGSRFLGRIRLRPWAYNQEDHWKQDEHGNEDSFVIVLVFLQSIFFVEGKIEPQPLFSHFPLMNAVSRMVKMELAGTNGGFSDV